MSARANLKLVRDGEIPAEGPQTFTEALLALVERDDVIAGLERDIRGWAARYAELHRDREAEAMGDPLWAEAERLFAVWRICAGKTKRVRLTFDRFELVKPFLSKESFEDCASAIIGRCFDCWSDARKNGSRRYFHEWERIFASRREFDESANRRPKDWREQLRRIEDQIAREAA